MSIIENCNPTKLGMLKMVVVLSWFEFVTVTHTVMGFVWFVGIPAGPDIN